jgi:CDP-diacylglycerol--serine O-phosphatidyltransferase
MAFQGNFEAVAVWVAVAALFDFLDGLAARLLKAFSPLGKELDSLADLVSFGVAPASAVFILLRDLSLFPGYLSPLHPWLPYLAFLIPVFSAFRLAKFNLDERQTTSFTGLPTPANGLFWIGYCCGMAGAVSENENLFYLTAVMVILLSLLMIAGIPMFSLKSKQLTKPLILVVLMILLVVFFGLGGIAWGIIAYILLSVAGRGERRRP